MTAMRALLGLDDNFLLREILPLWSEMRLELRAEKERKRLAQAGGRVKRMLTSFLVPQDPWPRREGFISLLEAIEESKGLAGIRHLKGELLQLNAEMPIEAREEVMRMRAQDILAKIRTIVILLGSQDNLLQSERIAFWMNPLGQLRQECQQEKMKLELWELKAKRNQIAMHAFSALAGGNASFVIREALMAGGQHFRETSAERALDHANHEILRLRLSCGEGRTTAWRLLGFGDNFLLREISTLRSEMRLELRAEKEREPFAQELVELKLKTGGSAGSGNNSSSNFSNATPTNSERRDEEVAEEKEEEGEAEEEILTSGMRLSNHFLVLPFESSSILIGCVAKWPCRALRLATSAALPNTRRLVLWARTGST